MIWESYQAYIEEPIKICPACNGENARRIYSLGYISVKGVTTLGKLAEQNNRKLGGKRQELIKEMKESRVPTFKGTLPSTASVMTPPSEDKTPWWREKGEAVDINLAKMNPEQTEKYVMTGKKPIPLGGNRK